MSVCDAAYTSNSCSAVTMTELHKVLSHSVCAGELLVRKANEGVKVLLLVWDDGTSNPLLKDGFMATHDEVTSSSCGVLAKHLPCHCGLCPRQCALGERSELAWSI